MNCNKLLFVFLAMAVLVGCTLATIPALAQSLTTGDITGIITDPSGAVLPNAPVTLTNTQTGTTRTLKTNSSGSYRFSLLDPGTYTVSASPQGFQPTKQAVTVSVGQASTVNLQLALATAGTTVEVTAQSAVVQADNANLSTTFSPQMITNIPNPGNDLTYYVQTAPGAAMNTQSGFGNTALYGISATSNLFTVDGSQENDPFLNLNNSGATNLLLGANDIQTATVVNNGYSGQYGTFAGANVNYVTKSGTNNFHGNLQYFWNGRIMNANDWFLNHTGTPRSFDNVNQWAASFGGPIIKDNTFFFANTEGLRIVLPTSNPVNIPSPQFEAATLANLRTNGNAAQIPFYNRVFSLYNSASGASRAANILPGPSGAPGPSGGCDGTVTLAGGAPCALQFQSNVSNLSTEWLLTARVDHNFSEQDRAFIHFRTDHGLQATYTDPLSKTLNAQSVQPQYEGQIQWNHVLSPSAVNTFLVAGSWYSAIFQPPSLASAQSLMPFQLIFPGGPPFGSFYTPGGFNYSTWPQGRNVTQYQIGDDFSKQLGNHALKFGIGFRRNDITDFTPGGFFTQIPSASFATLSSFFNGTVDAFTAAFAIRNTQPLALYTLGFYGQDEWAVKSNFKLTLALRAEHFSNPVCQTNCFSNLTGPFLSVNHSINQPYNQIIRTGLHQALPNYQSIAFLPRIGFAYQPFGSGNTTVIRGGFGMFADVFPGTVGTLFDTNSPLKNQFIASGLPWAPGVANNAQSATAASNAAFLSGFARGLSFPQVSATTPLFTPPAFTTTAHRINYPTTLEWNFEVQQPLGPKSALSLNYVGNHGYHQPAQNSGLNAFCNSTILPFQPAGTTPCTTALGIRSFVGLPTSPIDPAFSTINEISSPAVSNYNGLIVSFTRRFASLQVQANYAWSHALDEISNGGFLPFNFKTNFSPLVQQDPFNLRRFTYGNADYDVRQNFSMNYVYDTPKYKGLVGFLTSWTISGNVFTRTGFPFTVVDSAGTTALSAFNYGGGLANAGAFLFGNQVGPVPKSCGRGAIFRPCFTSAEFLPAVGPAISGFGNQRRNQIYGPSFIDTDIAVMKNIPLKHPEGARFQIGLQAFNVLNHPNFDQPVASLSSPQFGSVISTVSVPTSILGAFLGGNASPRMLQVRAAFQF